MTPDRHADGLLGRSGQGRIESSENGECGRKVAWSSYDARDKSPKGGRIFNSVCDILAR